MALLTLRYSKNIENIELYPTAITTDKSMPNLEKTFLLNNLILMPTSIQMQRKNVTDFCNIFLELENYFIRILNY